MNVREVCETLAVEENLLVQRAIATLDFVREEAESRQSDLDMNWDDSAVSEATTQWMKSTVRYLARVLRGFELFDAATWSYAQIVVGIDPNHAWPSDLIDWIDESLERFGVRHPLGGNRSPETPPRYATFQPGISGAVFEKHVAHLIFQGESLSRGLQLEIPQAAVDNRRREVQEWIWECQGLLRGLRVVENSADASKLPPRDFRESLASWEAGWDLGRVAVFARMCVLLGVEYLKKVQINMDGYIDASNQDSREPRYSQTFNGPVYGQAAMRIDNINSTIAGIMKQGDAEMGAALKALEEAIVADTAEDEERRRDLLDNLEVLAGEAGTAPEERRRGVVRTMLSSFRNAAMSGPEVAKAMEAWGQILGGLAG